MFDRSPKPKMRAAVSSHAPDRSIDQPVRPASSVPFELGTIPLHPPGGRPRPNQIGLPKRLKAGVEALSGLAMDDARVRYHSPEPARLGAHAYAKGRDIHLAPGQERHLPHEAWPVMQQARARVPPTVAVGHVPFNEDRSLEASSRAVPSRAVPSHAPAAGAPAQLARGPRRRRAPRRKPKIVLSGGRISGVPKFERGSTNLAGGRQGSHRTAHVALRAVGRSNLLGLSLDNARANLKDVVRRLKTLPTVSRLTGRHADNLRAVEAAVRQARNAPAMAHAVEQLQLFQGLLPGASGRRGSLKGHGEGHNNNLLNEYEDRERRGVQQRFSKAEVAKATWQMLDYKPAATEKQKVIRETVHRHMVHMKNGWPRTMKAARTHVYRHLRDNHGTIFSDNLDDSDGEDIAEDAIGDADDVMGEDVNE